MAHPGIATVVYRFDIAVDSSFTTLVTSGSVSEGATQTSFVPSVDLIPGTMYVWRARAEAPDASVAGPYSAGQAFTIINPDDGLFRYNLLLHFASVSNCLFYSQGGGAYPWNPPRMTDYAYDNGLRVNGAQLAMGPIPVGATGGLTVTLQRTGTDISGTLEGDIGVAPGAAFLAASLQHGAVTGTADDPSGSVHGVARATLILHSGGLSDIACDANIMVTLTPHP